jgi:hypothetical protein
MDFLKLLKSLEELLYQSIVLLVLFPKTFVKVLVGPSWVTSYVNSEWEKPAEDRFDQYVSPLLFLFLGVVLPFVVGMKLSGQYNVANIPPESLPGILGIADEQSFLAYIAIYSLTLPLSFTTVSQVISRRQLGFRSMQRVFYAQCFLATPLLIAMFVSAFASIFSRPVEIGLSLSYPAFLIWFVYSQVRFFKLEVNAGTAKSLGFVFISLVFYFVLVVLLLLPFIAFA